jgi:hypothetical protein
MRKKFRWGSDLTEQTRSGHDGEATIVASAANYLPSPPSQSLNLNYSSCWYTPWSIKNTSAQIAKCVETKLKNCCSTKEGTEWPQPLTLHTRTENQRSHRINGNICRQIKWGVDSPATQNLFHWSQTSSPFTIKRPNKNSSSVTQVIFKTDKTSINTRLEWCNPYQNTLKFPHAPLYLCFLKAPSWHKEIYRMTHTLHKHYNITHLSTAIDGRWCENFSVMFQH